MSTTIGSLIAELDLDYSKYGSKLKHVHDDSLRTIADVEKSASQTFKRIHLKLTPEVDDQSLTDLNAHLNLKRRHFQEVQRYFNQNPLTARTDISELTRLQNALNKPISDQTATINVKVNDLDPAIAKLERLEQLLDSVQAKSQLKISVPDTRQQERRSPVINEPVARQPGVQRLDDPIVESSGVDGDRLHRQMDTVIKNQTRQVRADTQQRQKKPGMGEYVVDRASSAFMDKTVGAAVDMAIEEGLIQILEFTARSVQGQIRSIPILKFMGIDKQLISSIGYAKRSAMPRTETILSPEQKTRKGGFTGLIQEAKQIASIPAKIITAPAKNAAQGFFEGIGTAYAESFAEGAKRGFEQRTGKKIDEIGENVSSSTLGAIFTGTGAAEGIIGRSSKLTKVEENLRPVFDKYAGSGLPNIDPLSAIDEPTRAIGAILSKSLDADQASQSINDLKKSFLDLGVAIATLDDVDGKLGSFFNNLQAATKYPYQAVVDEYKRSAKQSAELIRERSDDDIEYKDIRSDAKRVALVSAGFSGTKGAQSHNIAKKVEGMVPETTQVIPFENRNFDVDTPVQDDAIGWGTDILGVFSKALEQGYNQDAVNMAREAYQYSQANPGVGIDLIGHSGGGFIATEAQAILKQLGIIANVLTVATPLLGITDPLAPNRASVMGEGDALKFLSPNQPITKNIGGHEFASYADSPEYRRIFEEFAKAGVTPEMLTAIDETQADYGVSDFAAKTATSLEQLVNSLDLSEEQFARLSPTITELVEKIRSVNAKIQIDRNVVTSEEPPPRPADPEISVDPLSQSEITGMSVEDTRRVIAARTALMQKDVENALKSVTPESSDIVKNQANQVRRAMKSIDYMDLSEPLDASKGRAVRQAHAKYTNFLDRVGGTNTPDFATLAAMDPGELTRMVETDVYGVQDVDQESLKQQLARFTKSQLTATARNAGRSGYSKLNKADLIDFLSEGSRKELSATQTSANEQDILLKLSNAEKELTAKINQFKNAGTDQALDALAEARAEILNQINSVNEALDNNLITGTIRSSVGGIKGRLEQRYLDTVNKGSNSDQIRAARERLQNLANQAPPETPQEPPQQDVSQASQLDDLDIARVRDDMNALMSDSIDSTKVKKFKGILGTLDSFRTKVSNSIKNTFSSTGNLDKAVGTLEQEAEVELNRSSGGLNRTFDFIRGIKQAFTKTSEVSDNLTTITNDFFKHSQTRYEAIAKQVASLSNVELDVDDLPTLEVADDLLNEAGASALYDAKNNTIKIRQGIKDVLENGGDLSEYSDELVELIHELRHATQLDFGRISLSDLSDGRASPNVDLQGPQNISQYNLAKASVENAEARANRAGINLNDNDRITLQKVEADAYQFEGNTPDILKNAQASANQAVADAQSSLDGDFKAALEGMTGSLDAVFPGFSDKINGAIGLFEQLKTVGSETFVALMAWKGLQWLTSFLQGFTQTSLSAALSMERLEVGLTSALGSARKGAEAFKDIEETIERTGGVLEVGVQGYSALASSTQGTRLEGLATEQIFNATQEAAAANQLSPEETERMTVAIQQMAAKGRISSEELRQQMAEVLPQSFQVAARAMGVTTEELSRMLERGEVVSEEFLPKFAQQLSAESASGLAAAADTAQTSINGLNNEIFQTQAAFGTPLQPAQKLGLDTLTNALKLVRENAGTVVQVILSLATVAFIALIGSVKTAVVGVIALLAKLGLLPAVLATIKGALAAVAGALKSLLANAAVVYAIVEVGKLFANAFKDGGKEIRQFAETAENGLKDYTKALTEAREAQDDFNNSLPSSRREINGPSLLESTAIGGLARAVLPDEMANSGVRKAEGALRAGFSFTPLGVLGRSVNAMRGGGFRMPSYAEVQANQQSSARDELSYQVNQIMSEAYAQIGIDGKGVAETAQLRDVDKRLQDTQARRRAIAPEDAEGRRELDAEIDSLLKEREKYSKVTGMLQKQLSSAQGSIETTIEELNEKAAAGLIDAETYDRQLAQYENDLESIVKLQDQYNALVQEPADHVEMLARSFREVTAELQAANRETERFSAMQSKNVALARLGGASRGEVYSLEAQNQQEILAKKIEDNRKAMSGLMSDLSGAEVSRALELTGLGNLEDITPEMLAEQAGRFSEGRERDVLELAAQRYTEFQQLEIETLNLEAEALNAQADAIRHVKEVNKEVSQFYREVANRSEELALEVAQTAAQTDFGEVKNRLKSAMSGISGSFIDDWIGGFLGFLDTLQEIVQARIDADKQRMEAAQQQFAQTQAFNQLQRNMPGAIPGVTGSSTVQSGLVTGPSAYIGGSSSNHVDHKIPKKLGEETAIRFMDQLAEGYAAQGRRMEFSNSAVRGEVWDINASMDQKRDLLRRVDAAHSHSPNPTYWDADYYLPKNGDARSQSANSSSAGVNMLMPQIAGAEAKFSKASRYGNFVNVYDESGQLLFKMGHGDNRQSLPSNFTMGASTAPSMAAGSSASTGQSGGSRAGQAFNFFRSMGASDLGAAMLVGNIQQESGFDPSAVGDDGDAHGIFQWHPDRRNSSFPANDFQGQLAYAWKEFAGRNGSAVRGMDFQSGISSNDPATVKKTIEAAIRWGHEGRRWEYGQQALQQYGGQAQPAPISVNNGQLNQAGSMMQTNYAQQAALINEQEQLRVRQLEVEARAAAQGLIRQSVQQQRSLQDQSIDLDNQMADRAIANLPQGDIRSGIESNISAARETRAADTGLTRQMQDLDLQIESLHTAKEEALLARDLIARQVSDNLLDPSQLREADEVINSLDLVINDTETFRGKLEAIASTSRDFNFDQQYTSLTRQLEDAKAAAGQLDPIQAATLDARRNVEELEKAFDAASAAYRASLDPSYTEDQADALVAAFEAVNGVSLDAARKELEELTRSAEQAQEAALIQFQTEGLQELTRVLNRSGQPQQAQEANYLNQVRQIDNEERQSLLDIDQRTDLSQEAKEKARGLVRETASNRRLNADFDYNVGLRETELSGRQAVLDSQSQLLGAGKSRADMLGYGGIAPIRQQEMNLELGMQEISFQNQILELEQLKDAGKLTNEQFEAMRQNIEATNEMSIDNIKTQFSDLPEIVGAIKQPMTDALSSWIQGTKSFDEAFSDMLSSILSNLVSMMANKAIEGLLGSLFGGMGGSGGGATGGIFGGGGLLGGLFGGIFKDGGQISSGLAVPTFMGGGPLHGKDPIKDALKKEGPGARLIVANTSEWVLNRKHQEILRSYGVDEKVLGFKDGGPVGNMKAPGSSNNSSSSPNVSVNIPVNISGDSDIDGTQLAKRIADPVKALIASEVQKMQRPGGQLRSRK